MKVEVDDAECVIPKPCNVQSSVREDLRIDRGQNHLETGLHIASPPLNVVGPSPSARPNIPYLDEDTPAIL